MARTSQAATRFIIALVACIGIGGAAAAQSARAIPELFPVVVGSAFPDLDTLVRRIAPVVGVPRRDMRAALLRLLRKPLPRRAWNDDEERLRAHVGKETGWLKLRARLGGFDGNSLEVRMDVDSLAVETRASLAAHLAAAAREMRIARASPVKGKLIVTLSERAGPGRGPSGTEAGGTPTLAFRTSERLGCVLMLDADLGRVGDTLVLASYGTPRSTTSCGSAYVQAVGETYYLPSSPGLYELRVQWNGREDRYRLSIDEHTIRTDRLSGDISQLEGVPRWRFLPNTLTLSCSADGSPARLCAELFRAMDRALGAPTNRFGDGLVVPFDEAVGPDSGKPRIYEIASAEAHGRACPTLIAFWRALVRPSPLVSVMLADGTGLRVQLRGGQGAENDRQLDRCKATPA